MKKTNERLIEGADVPLLEQEKINELLFDGIKENRIGIKYQRLKMLMTFLVSIIAVLVICIFVILSSKLFGKSNGDDSATGENGSTHKPVTDVGVIQSGTATDSNTVTDPCIEKDLYEYDFSSVPEGEIPIVPMDLSFFEKGASYIINSTGFIVDAKELLQSSLSSFLYPELLTSNSSPKVLIIHTHGSEAYSPDGEMSYADEGGEFMRSEDANENVVSLGEYLAELLNKKGISTVHCSVMHDNIQSKDSFSRSEATIKEYLTKYPSIKVVIDLHRDKIISSEGHIIRPVTIVDGKATAQIKCIVGSSWGGEECPNWERNLSFAIKLREKLNCLYTNVCRPPELKALSYNQELSPYSIMLEIGSCGNSYEEAHRAVEYISGSLAELISKI
ncbi:MAG: stage II sporulation protein P [Clostridia bacterium]|nr:stage II sporulation protein P [Clostridia bacterium]